MGNETRTKKRKRLSRSEKINKRLRGVKKGIGDISHKKAMYVVNVVKEVPVEVNGFLVARYPNAIYFRHKRTNASKKMRISIFLPEKVISLYGDVGKTSQLVIRHRKQIASYKGYISFDKNSNIVIKDVNGEITILYPSEDIELDIFADEGSQSEDTFRDSSEDDDIEEDEEEIEDDDYEEEDSDENFAEDLDSEYEDDE